MQLSAPKSITWWIALILTVIALVAKWTSVLSFLTPYAFVVLLVGFILLCLGTFVKGL